MTITICASTTFYKDILAIEEELKTARHTVLVPEGVETMREQKSFDPDKHKLEFIKNKDFKLKKKLIDLHIAKITEGDAVLIINNEKKHIQGYIGGNVLMEMTIAYFLKKPIYLWNELSADHPFLDEVCGMMPIVIHHDISQIHSL